MLTRTSLLAFSAVSALSLLACTGDDEASVPDAGGSGADAATTDGAPVPDAGVLADAAPAEITLAFTPVVDDEPFACGTVYGGKGAEATDITPRDFRMYVHDVELITASGERVPLALTQDGEWQLDDVVLLDFEDFTGGCADGTPATNTEIRGTAPAGTYDGVAFKLGIPAALNHQDLIDVAAPLNLTGLWWGWNFGHIFVAIVTHADLTDPEPSVNDHYIHIGSTGCTGDAETGETVTCTNPNRAEIVLTGFDPTTTPIVADFGAVIAQSNLATSDGCHSFTQGPCAWPFELVGLSWLSGTPTPTTQKLFRVATP